MLKRDIIADRNDTPDVSNGIFSHRTAVLESTNLELFVKGDSSPNHGRCEHARSRLHYSAGSFPTWSKWILELDIVEASQKEDVAGVEHRTVHFDEELVGAWLLDRRLAEPVYSIRLDLHTVHHLVAAHIVDGLEDIIIQRI